MPAPYYCKSKEVFYGQEPSGGGSTVAVAAIEPTPPVSRTNTHATSPRGGSAEQGGDGRNVADKIKYGKEIRINTVFINS